MGNEDNRKLPVAEQVKRRRKAVALFEKKMADDVVAVATGYSRRHIKNIRLQYETDIDEALVLEKRGPKVGTTRILEADQEKLIRNILLKKTPDKMGMENRLWTKDLVRQLMIFGLDIDPKQLNPRTITDYLRRWGFLFENPNKVGRTRNGDLFDRWREIEYPKLLEDSKREGYEIHWGAICKVKESNDYRVISSISNKGQIRFVCYKNAMTRQKFLKFLSSLIDDSNRKVLLILYKQRMFELDDELESWLDGRKLKIELEYLEGYY